MNSEFDVDQKVQGEKEAETPWEVLVLLLRIFTLAVLIAWMLRRRKKSDEEFLVWATSKERSSLFWMLASVAAQQRYGRTRAVKRIHAINYARNPDFDGAVISHIRSLYEDQNWAEIASVNIIPCLDGDDDQMKWTRQIHAYAQRQVDESNGEFPSE
ncbi:MAG: hypothetical protein RLZZ303_2710 [Candidatus Hydrogenedentota bacterium]|jgi:hypothetical protein